MKNFALALLLSTTLFGCGFEIVDTGNRGVETSLGKVVGEPLPEGLHWYNPVSGNIIEMNVQEQKMEGEISCYSKDNQQITAKIVAIFAPNPAQVHVIYRDIGLDYEEKIITPAVTSAIKDVVGQYTADTIVSQRPKAGKEIFAYVKEKLAARNIIISSVELVNIDFEDGYEKAVEEKVIAIQRAEEAKNKTVQIEEEKKQTILAAQGEAEAMRIKTNALAQNPALVQYEAVQKWNGELPQYMMGNSVPFININK